MIDSLSVTSMFLAQMLFLSFPIDESSPQPSPFQGEGTGFLFIPSPSQGEGRVRVVSGLAGLISISSKILQRDVVLVVGEHPVLVDRSAVDRFFKIDTGR